MEYNDGDISSKRELQLSVKWTQKQPTWLADATFTVKGPKQTDWTAAEFDPAKTEYTVDIASTANSRTFTLTPTAAAVEAGVYFQFLLDDAPVISTLGNVVAPQQFTSTDTVKATRYTFDLAKVPVGTTHVVKLLVGPLTDGATNLKEADCNVYTFTVNRTVGINDLVVKDSEGNTATLNPAFHVQENRFETEVSGSTIKIKTGWVNPTKVYVGNSTEPANSGTSNFAWTNVNLAEYTAKGSDTAVIPIRVVYEKDEIKSEKTITLSVKWTQEQSTWLADASFDVVRQNSLLTADNWKPVVAFNPEKMEYTADIADTAGYQRIMLTPTEEAVQNNIYYQFLFDGKPVEDNDAKVLPQRFEKAEETDVTEKAFTLDQLPIGTTHTLKLLVGPLADGASILDENNCNVYTFKLTRKVGFYLFYGADVVGQTNFKLAPEFSIQEDEYSTAIVGDTISLTVDWMADAKVYLGSSTEAVEGKVKNTTNTIEYRWEQIKLSEYTQSGTDIAVIPVRIMYDQDGIHSERTVKLSVKWTDPEDENTPKITKRSDDVTCEKGEQKTLSIEVAPVKEGAITYQWYCVERGTTRPAYGRGLPIKGATEATYTPSTTNKAGQRWYGCKVTNTTPSGRIYETFSEYIGFNVKLSYVDAPVIKNQPGTFVMKTFNTMEEGAYKTTYHEGDKCDPIYIGVETAEDGTDRSFSWYYNTEDTASGGEAIESKFYRSSNGWYGYYLNKNFDAGTYYIYCVVRDTDKNNSENYRETTSETCKIVFEALNADDFEGSGTEADPYLLKTQADMQKLQERVNTDGVTYAGTFFKMVNDITLQDQWRPIGCTKDGSSDIKNGLNLNVFAGTIDGQKEDGTCVTLTVPKGGLPLLGYVKGATIKNLNIYGEQIEGAGLVNSLSGNGLEGNAVTIDHVTLKSGTKTLKSGLIHSVGGNGYACSSAKFVVTVQNCTIEEGVTIGYKGTTGQIGSIANRCQGTIDNCVSYATVKGSKYVGGLLGTMDNAMGKCVVQNSQFHGTVEATGSYAGGIVGGGYCNGNSAPNGGRPSIIGCTVDGTVTGDTCVGGITGGDQYVAQTRANVAHSVTGNTFTGTVSGSRYVGGIIGYYNSLNKYDTISGNTYSNADTGIGYVKYIDTSYENPTLMNGTIAFNTGATTEGLPDIQWNTWKAGLNREDDPLGADKDKLAKKSDGTETPVCTELKASGTYKTEYTVGEELDLTGIVLTAYWSLDKKPTTVDLKDVTITGYDKDKEGQQTISLTYGDATLNLTVTVKPNSSKIKISISVLGDEKHDDTKGPHGLTMGGLTEWAKEDSFDADTSETVWDALQRVFKAHNITVEASWSELYNSIYISKVNGIGEFDNGQNSGWMYTVNGKHSDVGVSAKYLHEGDVIIFHYTDDYSLEKDDVEGMMPAEVIRLIKEIPDKITLEAEKAITAARAAYEKLTEADRDQVINYQKLLDAEKELSALKHSANARNIHAVTGNYLKGLSDKTAPTVSSIGGDWLVMGLTRSSKDVPAGYFDNVAAYVKKNINASGQLNANKSTENSRVILALTAAGFDPRNVGGYNLLNGLSDMDFIKKQGLNGPIWALIALDSHNYSTPAGTVSNPTTREKLVETILNAQLADGGWAYSGTVADSDMTGMALQALAPYYKLKTNDKLTSAVDKAIAKLSTMQKDNGAFATYDGTITSESISQVLVALTALGIDPNTDERFVKNGFSAVDALLDYAVDGGGFEHLKGQGMDGMATEQGYYALTSYIRMRDGKTTLYDMSDVTLKVGKVTDSGDNGNSGTTDDQAKKDQAAADKVEKLIDAIGTVTVNSETRIKKARNAYDRLTDAQKKLVSNYQDLKDAEKDLKKAKVSYVEDLIDSIGNVTLNSKTKINRARTAYDKLDKSLKDDVGNLSVLEAAEAAYKKLLDGSSTADDTAKKTTGTATGKAAGKSYGTATGKASAGTGSTGELTAIAGSVEELLDNITDDSIAGEILDAILAYEDLTTEEQAALGRDRQIEDLKKRAAELNQTDRTTGISVSGVDWNIRLVIGDVLDVETIANLKEQLQNCDMLSLWDISLEDVLTGEKYEPTGTVLVKIPLALLGDYSSYDGIAVAHYGEYGNVEYLNCTVMGDCLVFNTVEFSRYAVVGFNGAFDAEGLMTASVNADGTATPAEGMPWLPWALAGGCGAALLIALLMLAQKKQKSEVGS